MKRHDQRLVAFLDILGFRGRVERESLEEVHRLYGGLIEEARREVFTNQTLPGSAEERIDNFEIATFAFDSIVLVSMPLDPQNVFHFVAATLHLMERCFTRSLPLRGGISLGDVIQGDEPGVLLCKEIPALLAWEKKQEWTGCTVFPTAAPVLFEHLLGGTPQEHETLTRRRDAPLVRYDVPLKDEPAETRWCLNWVSHLSLADLEAGMKFLHEPKHANTRAFADAVLALPDDARKLPATMEPATRLRWRFARGGMQLKFAADDERGVDPPGGFQVDMIFRKKS